jgi:hypothetical protein
MATFFCRLTAEHGHARADEQAILVLDTEFAGRHGPAALAAERYARWHDNVSAEYPLCQDVVVVGPGVEGPERVFEVELASVPEYTAKPKREGK